MESGKWKGVFAGSGLPSTYIHTYSRGTVSTYFEEVEVEVEVGKWRRACACVCVCVYERTNLEVPRYVWKNRIEDGATEMEIGKCDLSSRDLGVVLLRGKKK